MDLKDDPLMMGAFAGSATDCNLPIVSAYHEINLQQSLESQPPMSVSSAITSMSTSHLSQSQPSSQSQTTATPVLSLFKLKNFLYQPKFKNLLHSEGEQSSSLSLCALPWPL